MPQDLGIDYFDVGTQYYVSARFSLFAELRPVAANLFHHAIEMFMKGYLLGSMSPQDLKEKYAHRLNKLWRAVKTHAQDPALDKFDQTVIDLHRYEELRYPPERTGYTIMFEKRRGSSSLGPTILGGGSAGKLYLLCRDEIDELAVTLFDKAGLNPVPFAYAPNAEGLAFLKLDNEKAERWGQGRP